MACKVTFNKETKTITAISPRTCHPSSPALRKLLSHYWLTPLHALPVSGPPAPRDHLARSPFPLGYDASLIYLPRPLDCKLYEVRDHIWGPRTSSSAQAWGPCPLIPQWCRDDGNYFQIASSHRHAPLYQRCIRGQKANWIVLTISR